MPALGLSVGEKTNQALRQAWLNFLNPKGHVGFLVMEISGCAPEKAVIRAAALCFNKALRYGNSTGAVPTKALSRDRVKSLRLRHLRKGPLVERFAEPDVGAFAAKVRKVRPYVSNAPS